jgi:surface antigen
MKHSVTALLAGAAALVPALACAQLGVFSHGPLAKMTKADTDIAMASVRETLDKAADGEKRTWSNPATGATGTITPRRSFVLDSLGCREVFFETRAGGVSGSSKWTLCKHGAEWKIHGARSG